ncbi:hypothetical protein GF420_06105 [candidate division GN15 bacterium]|nr:hypothetical protein [candidate division GN15 bacterium]
MSECLRSIVIIVAALVVVGLGPIDTAAKTRSTPFSEQVFEAVYRIVGDDGDVGTCFFVSCPSNTAGSSLLITARHVLDNIDSDTARVYLRKPTDTTDSYEIYSLPIAIRDGGEALYESHADTTIDLAAIRVALPADFEVRVVSRMLLARAVDFVDLDITPGASVSYLGYPRGYSSGEGDFALIRTGHIASHPVDLERMFLVDGTVYEGNSGGLVYFAPRLDFNNQGRLIKESPRVIGVMTTSIARSVRAEDTISVTEREYLNLGGVISSVRLLELLDQLGCGN